MHCSELECFTIHYSALKCAYSEQYVVLLYISVLCGCAVWWCCVVVLCGGDVVMHCMYTYLFMVREYT